MPLLIKKFVFNLNELGDGPLVIDDADEDNVVTWWEPFTVESDPESSTVWVWAYSRTQG